MAERSEEYIKRLAELLCRKYHETNTLSYNFVRESNKNEPEYDFFIGNPRVIVGVQLKTLENTAGYFKELIKIHSIITELKKRIKIYNLTNIWLNFKFRQLPENSEEIDEFLKDIFVFLLNHFRIGSSKYIPRFMPEDVVLLNNIFKYLSEFWFDWISQSEPFISFGHDNWHFGGPIDMLVDDILSYIKSKDQHYGKTSGILLFEVDPMPPGDLEVSELRNRCSNIKFNFAEVWLINLGNEGFCEKIYPWS